MDNSVEIGSHFSLVKPNNYHDNFPNYIRLNSGRACFHYASQILSDYPILLPNYLCPSIVQEFRQSKLFYQVNNELEIDYDDLVSKVVNNKLSAVMIIHYFGKIDKNIDKIINYLRSKDILIIEDTTHSYLDNNSEYGDIIVSSIRKTLPILDGAIIKTKLLLNVRNQYKPKYLLFLFLRFVGMFLKNYIKIKWIWRYILLKADTLLENTKFHNSMSKLSQFIVDHLDLNKLG